MLLSMVIVANYLREFKVIRGSKFCVIRGIETIPCPICGGRLYHYDSRSRSVRVDEEKQYQFLLRRLRCKNCHKLHLELPSFLLPGQRCFKVVIEQALNSRPVPVVKDPRTPARWRKWWKKTKAYLLAALQSLVHRKKIWIIQDPQALTDLARILVNHGLWPFHLLRTGSLPESSLHSP